MAREERRLAKARAKDEERKRLRAEREAKAAANKKKTPVKKKVTLDAEAMRSPPDGPASLLTPSPKRGRSRSQSVAAKSQSVAVGRVSAAVECWSVECQPRSFKPIGGLASRRMRGSSEMSVGTTGRRGARALAAVCCA